MGRYHRPQDGFTVKHRAEYEVWWGMLRRCYDKKCISYPRYGSRGVTVCDRWRNSFDAFVEDMGSRPRGTQIDRKDDALVYSKETCRWVTLREQANNRRNTVFVTWLGKSWPLADLARAYGIRRDTLFGRVRSGWPIEQALGTPIGTYGKQIPSANRISVSAHVKAASRSKPERRAA